MVNRCVVLFLLALAAQAVQVAVPLIVAHATVGLYPVHLVHLLLVLMVQYNVLQITWFAAKEHLLFATQIDHLHATLPLHLALPVPPAVLQAEGHRAHHHQEI